MVHPEYMQISYNLFSVNIQQQYNLKNKVTDGYIFIKIKKGYVWFKSNAHTLHTTTSNLTLNHMIITR